ncbi:hypothetical protein [Streptomyces sp. NBC_01465]|uniref:hypothetical protein n=1 Tax=Streptomyces sp. NBC_01465 TaxID=2903878 RepID=UPI002E34087B|nr:hypothetical protein [Streptomyces sp. NBC_01465]
MSTLSEQTAVSPEWIVVDAVAAVEVHVDRSLESLINDSGVSGLPIGATFLSRYGEDMSRSWDARYEWLSDGFGVKVKGAKFQQDFHAVIECRNAIVHGSGNLTKRQRSSFGKFIQLRKQMESVLNVRVHGTEVSFSVDSARNALRVASAFVQCFDSAVHGVTNLDY